MIMLCRLCSSRVVFFTEWQSRQYFRCSECSLIQLHRNQCPSQEEELGEYELHENDQYDKGYRKFLSPVTDAILTRLQQKQEQEPLILDFGSGPGPTISVVLQEHGWKVNNYDPFFFPNTETLEKTYDVIACTEVVEHFYEPKTSWEQLFSLVKPRGVIFVMTQSSDNHCTEASFQKWRYIREKSHVAFYHSHTMDWLANTYGLGLSKLEPRVFAFSRK